MTFSGDLQGISLADVFQNISANRSTGWLQVRWRQRSCSVRFSEGAVSGFSFGEGETLVTPEFLVQRGVVEAEAMRRLMTKHRRSRKTCCKLAIAAKLIDGEIALDAVMTRVEEQIYDLMLVKEAAFSFTEGQPPTDWFDVDQHPDSIRLEVGPLLMEGARRRDEWQHIHRLVGTDRDLVVLQEGWEEFELQPLQAELSNYLDGQTDARTLMKLVFASRFETMKALADLVQLGAARLATASEIEDFADQARAAGELDRTVQMLQQALTVERTNEELRTKFIDVLVELGRPKDAAAELAKMAHHAAVEGDVHQATEMYARAHELDPEDLPLLEQRVALLRDAHDDEAYVIGVRELVALYLDIGLADRARTALREATAKKSLRTHDVLLELLASVESSLGHWAESGRIYRQLGEQWLARDEAKGVAYLQSALEQTPDDTTLSTRIRDIESGLAQRRRRSRRRFTAMASVACVLVAFVIGGVAEFRATRRVIEAFDGSLALHESGDAVGAMVTLESVRRDVVWSPTQGRAIRLFERLTDMQLDTVEGWIRSGDYVRARTVLEDIVERIDRADLLETCRALLTRIDLEQRACAVLQRADREGVPQSEDLDALAELVDPAYLDFHLANLPTIQDARVRHAVLLALAAIDSPRSVPSVARLFLAEQDALSIETMRSMLESAVRFRSTDHAHEWLPLRAELDSALNVDETRAQAQLLLDLLFL